MATHVEEHRAAELAAHDPQFAAAMPDSTVAAKIQRADRCLPAVLAAVFDGYAERPAVGQRAYDTVRDPDTGRVCATLRSEFTTMSYRELGQRADRAARALLEHLSSGERVCVLGFASVQYAIVDIALTLAELVAVPLQAGAATAALQAIIDESEPSVLVAGVEHLPAAIEVLRAAAQDGHTPDHLVVMDYRSELTDDRDALQGAHQQLADLSITIDTLDELDARGAKRPELPAHRHDDDDPLCLLVYTSGSTGAPKGAMYRQSQVATMWNRALGSWQPVTAASIILEFLPMNHVVGRSFVTGTLGHGGTVYFTAKSDQSTLLEDLRLTRPTELFFVPRIWEMLHAEYLAEINRRTASGADRPDTEAQVLEEFRRDQLGGRYLAALFESAPMSADLQSWVESLLGMPLLNCYGSTEANMVLTNNTVLRPQVIDYQLVDVPDLGYYHSDRPHPRGELVIKVHDMFAGYYKRPETTAEVFDDDGYYRTGDIFAETAPDHLVYVDRRNNVLKLAQGEFVTLAKLETVFGNSPLIHQIYLYGNSTQPFLLAVVVPTDEHTSKADLAASLQTVARKAGLQSYEVPRDFLIETTPFSTENGLLTGIRKLAWPKLKAHYGQQLEQLYTELADGRTSKLAELRSTGADGVVDETVTRAAAALLGAGESDPAPDARFTDLGGDSLSALMFGNLLREIFDVDVPVGVIVSPANDLAAIADYIAAQRGGTQQPSFAAVHGRDAVDVHATDLTLDKFLDERTLSAAPSLPRADSEVRTVLLTGATGFLGRYLALDWLERMGAAGGTVVALVRAKTDADARARLDATFDSGDPELLARYQRLAAKHLEVIAGDKDVANLGLDEQTWQRLADIVELIVDPAALVNHVLPYNELFGPNVVGTAELIKIALTSTIKPYTYLSTVAVADQIPPDACLEDADIRQLSATRTVDDSYANGYGNSKWAGEVLLREAHDLCGLPVAVFRCGMILADTTYSGQLNLPDMFTRLLFSVVATGIAPASFYDLDTNGDRPRAHYDGLPVEFIAEAISTLSTDERREAFQTYHVMNPHDDGISLDTFVDWLIDDGHAIHRVSEYDTWLTRFESALRGLPERQRHYSLLPLLAFYRTPQHPTNGSTVPTDQFRAAVQRATIGPDTDIPHVSHHVITKYVTDLQQLQVL